MALALSRISPRVRVMVSVSIVYRIATGGYSWIWWIHINSHTDVNGLQNLMHNWAMFPVQTERRYDLHLV